MSLCTFFGCLFLAYGPLLSIFFILIAPNAQYVLLMVSSIAIQELYEYDACIDGFFSCLVSGFGYALMTSLVSYISLLVESIGPGVVMCASCPKITLYFMSAITTTLFSLEHICWMVISFEGFSELPQIIGWLKVAWVILSHYGASLTTVLNASTKVKYGCVYSIVASLFIIAVSVFIIALSLKSKFHLVLSAASHRSHR
ncbi:MAG: Aph-1 protein-domain-containing protein [Benjaminiella poitrasii]|nr:MAG: Aph-1 protein-domain-containing protein [Benjaminiella poitrasii]